MSQLKSLLGKIKQNWNEPPAGNYIPYKEVVNIGAAGFGVHWASTLAATIGLDASNFLVGASIGLQPLHLSIMLIVANLVGMPIAFFRGWFFDNHKMPGGKFIPIMLRTPIPIVAISTVFVWLPYESFSYWTKVAVVWCMYMLLQFFLCLYSEGWAFFQQVVSPNAQERAYVMSISQILYSLAPTITGFVIPTVAGLTFGMNNIWTYRVIYPPFTLIGVVVLLIFFPKLNERIILPKRGVEYVSIADALREVAKNKYFWIINSAGWVGFLESAYGVILSWSFVYAFNGEKQAYLGLANTVISNAALWSMIVAPFMMNWLGKRNLLIAHNILNVILLLLLIPCYKNLFLVCVIFYINTFVNTFQNIYFPNIQADMRDYHQWKTGVRVDGLFGPLGLIGTVLGFATGLVLPTIYEHMGLKENYDILYNDEMRNNLFDVLIAASIIGAILNLIPYLFYDLTEQKHRGYVNVLRIRAMFEDYGNNELDDAQLKEAMEIINASKNNLQKKAVDKAKLKEAKKLKDKQERATQTEKAREEIREVKNHNKLISSLPIVTEELGKFSTARYQAQLERARQTLSLGEVCLYSDWKEEKLSAKKMSRANKEERVIRADAIKTAMDKKRSYKLLKKYGEENLVAPDSSIPEEIKGRTFENEAQRRQAKKELKAYTKAVSVYRRITKPYYDAKNLIIQEENYRRLDEIEALYEKVISAEE
ncbi:MAG: MFS transporter [Clostridia bacterium]|nr:MFS transporter [Clostridia bacterium]